MDTNFLFVNNDSDNLQLLDAYSRTVTGVVGAAAESVVHIEVQKKVRDRQNKQTIRPATGSGFVISSDGFIITNNHVIENPTSIKVSFIDGRRVNAEIKGADSSTDIAVLKIDETGLKALVLDDSSKLQ